MIKDDHERVSEALLGGLAPSDELRRRFEEQVSDLTRARISGWGRALRTGMIVVFGGTACVFAWASYLFATAEDPGLTVHIRTFASVSFAAGALLFAGGIACIVHELRHGRIAPRRLQQGMVFLPYSVVLFYGTFTLVNFREMFSTVESMAYAGISLLFFWIMAATSMLLYSSRWHREDILLEQKRTQLELAILREELSKKR